MRHSILSASWLSLVLIMPVHASLVKSLDSNTTKLAVGQVSNAAQTNSGLDSANAFGAYDFNLTYTPTLLHFDTATFSDAVLGDHQNLEHIGNIFPTIADNSSTAGLVEFFLDNSDLKALQTKNATHHKASFTVLTANDHPLSLRLNPKEASQDSAPSVSTVPLPGTFWLFVSAVTGLGMSRRRQNQT